MVVRAPVLKVRRIAPDSAMPSHAPMLQPSWTSLAVAIVGRRYLMPQEVMDRFGKESRIPDEKLA